MVNLILQEQQDKGRAWSTSCQDGELDPPSKPLPWGRRQAGCVPQAQHTQPTLIPQAWRAQTHPPWPRPDYSGINHTDYMLPKKEVLSLFRTGSDPLLASSSLKMLFSASSCLWVFQELQ